MTLREPLTNTPPHNEIIEQMIKRYSITYVPNRGVSLFDIVGFSLLSPFEQMMQLNSLSYSLNSAQAKLLSKRIGVDFSRTTTGDGFYIWNRNLSLEGNVSLYHFMQLVLADNAIAHKKAEHNTVPRLRASFHVGSSYEFHQAEGLKPTIHNFIVGDVTVELARIIERALPGQILVGDFRSTMRASGPDSSSATLDSVAFVDMATRSVGQLAGIELSGERVDAIRSYLTGPKLANGEFTVRRLVISDKHGISRRVYNAKVNIYRHNAEPILLGIEDRVLEPDRSAAGRRAAPCTRLTINAASAAPPPSFGSSGRIRSLQRRLGLRLRDRVERIAVAYELGGTREAKLVMTDGDQVAVAQTMLAHSPAVDEAAVRAAQVDQQPAVRASP